MTVATVCRLHGQQQSVMLLHSSSGKTMVWSKEQLHR